MCISVCVCGYLLFFVVCVRSCVRACVCAYVLVPSGTLVPLVCCFQGVAIDTAKAIGPLRQCDKAAIQKVNKVLIPPEDTIMDLINNDKDLRLGHQAAVV